MRVATFNLEIEGVALVVLSRPAPRKTRRARKTLGPLTKTEKSVVARLVRGESTARIAKGRGTSARTVANQIAAIYRKLGVGSRRELAALLR